MPLNPQGKETGWISAWAFQVGALSRTIRGRLAMADGYINAAKLDALAVTEAKIGALAVSEGKVAVNAISEGKLAAPNADGLHPPRIARVTYDFAEHGGAISTIGLGVTLPDNAIIVRAWYEVLTTLGSGTDAATVSIDIPTDDVAGIVAAIAISDVSNPWDAGLHEAIQDGAVANFSTKTTAARELSITIAVEAVTAGKFILFAEYKVSD